MKYSEIKNKEVIDANGEKIGNVSDAIFDISGNNIELRHFVLGGGRIEELLESMKARPDIDPICSIENIDSISDKVYLNVTKLSLLKTIDPGVLTDSHIKFSQLSKIQIHDSDGFKVGNMTDLWFDKESTMWFLIGGGFFEELLERIRAQPDCDLIIPSDLIRSVNSDAIVFGQTKFQLESTCITEYEREKKRLANEKDKEKQLARIRFGPPSPGMTRA